MNNHESAPQPSAKKQFPLILIALTILFAVILAVTFLRLTPSKHRMEPGEYFALRSGTTPEEFSSSVPTIFAGPNEAPVANWSDGLNYSYGYLIQDNETLQDSRCIFARSAETDTAHVYFPVTYVTDRLKNPRFYLDEEEATVTYCLPTRILTVESGKTSYRLGEESIATDVPALVYDRATESYYLESEFVHLYTPFSCHFYAEPDRAVLSLTNRTVANVIDTDIKDEGLAIRRDSSIKSPILTVLPKNDRLAVLSEKGKWTQVMTPDGFMGWVKTDSLSEISPLSLAITSLSDEGLDENYTSLTSSEKQCVLWHQVWEDYNGTDEVSDICGSAIPANVVCPGFFWVTNENGDIKNLGSAEYVSLMHFAGKKVWVMVDNINISIDSHALLSHAYSRRALISNLIEQTLALGADGINVDFEALKSASADCYIQFIRELSVDCRNNHLVLSVDNYVPSSSSSFYNRSEQAVFADYIIIMGYPEHYPGGTPGSTASLPFVKKGIEDTLKEVPKEKVINGVPLYSRVWNLNNGTTTVCSMKRSLDLMKQFPADVTWLETENQYHLKYVEDDIFYEAWLEESTSMEKRLEMMKSYDLAGVACWKYGFQTDDFWGLVEKYLTKTE